MTFWMIVVGVAAAFPSVAHAQSGYQLEVEMGTAGWMDPGQPIPVEVAVSAEVLFAGHLQVRYGTSGFNIPAEVPAGGKKTYNFYLSPLTASQPLRVSLISGDHSDPLASVVTQPKVADNEVLVGLLDQTDVGQLGRARTEVGGLLVEALPLLAAPSHSSPVSYLVAGERTPIDQTLSSWVERGGRLVIEAAALDQFDQTLVGEISGAQATRHRLGGGELIVVDDLAMSADDWGRLIRPDANFSQTDWWNAGETSQLRAAATSVSRSGIDTTVLLGLVAYGLVAAPLNLIVLKRMRRRQFAWLTVPAIAVVGAALLWLAGTVGRGSTTFAQATVVIADSTSATARTSLLVAANSARSHRLQVEGIVYPAAGLERVGALGSQSGRTVIDGNGVEVAFADPGYTAINIEATASASPVVEVTTNGRQASIEIHNTTPYSIAAYALIAGGRTSVVSGGLAPGASGAITSDPKAPPFHPGEMLMQAPRQAAFSADWNVVYNLTTAALEGVEGDAVVALIEEYPFIIDIDGQMTTVTGPAMMVVPLEGPVAHRTTGKVAATAEGASVNAQPPFLWIDAEWIIIGFRAPADRQVTLSHGEAFGPRFGPAVSLEAWNWSNRSFEDIDPGVLERGVIDENGDVFIRASNPGDDFGGWLSMNIGDLILEWDQ